MAEEFSFTITELDRGGKDYRFDVRQEWVRGTLEDTDIEAGEVEGELRVRASKSGRDVVVHGTLKSELVLACARCTETFKFPVETEVSALYVPAEKSKTPKDEEYEFSSEEADVETYVGDSIVLDSLVHDELLLAIPMIPLCSDECEGMTPRSEGSKDDEESTIDPRLLPLLRLKQKIEPA